MKKFDKIQTVHTAMMACQQWMANVKGMTAAQMTRAAPDVIALGSLKMEMLLMAIEESKKEKKRKPKRAPIGKESPHG